MMNLFWNYSSFILCGFFWPPPLWVKTKSGSPSCHSADYFFHFEGRFCRLHCILGVPSLTCYYGRFCTFYKWLHRVAQHLEKSCFLPNLNSSTCDFVNSFIFVNELYNATFVKDLGTPSPFFKNLLINRSIFFSILESDTSYICISHADLEIKPK